MSDEPLSRTETDDRAADLVRLGVAARRAVRKQILVLAALLILGVVLFLTYQSRADAHNRKVEKAFEHQIATQCVIVRGAFGQLNTFVAQQSINVANSKTLTPAQKQQAQQTYDRLHFSLGTCPPVTP